MARCKFDPLHPGVVLAEDFLKGLQITQRRLAKGIGVPPRRINETGEVAPALAKQARTRFLDFAQDHCSIAVPQRAEFRRAAELAGDVNRKLRAGAKTMKLKVLSV